MKPEATGVSQEHQGEFSAGQVAGYILFVIIVIWPLLLFAHWPLLIALPLFAGFCASCFIKGKISALHFILPVATGIALGLIYPGLGQDSPPGMVPYHNDVLNQNLRAIVLQNIRTLRYYSFLSPVMALMGSFLGYAAGGRVKIRRWSGIIMVALISASMFYNGLQLNISRFAEAVGTLPPGSYSFDGQAYNNAVHYMKQGTPYYESIAQSLNNRERPTPLRSVLNIRPPLLFWLWRLMPGDPSFIALLFSVAGCGFLFSVYFILLHDSGNPLLSVAGPAMIGYLLVHAMASGFYTFSEYWAWFFLAGALLAYRHGKHCLFAFLLCLCIMSREVFFFHWALLLIFALAGRDRRAVRILLSVFILCGLYYWYHFTSASGFIVDAGGAVRFYIGDWLRGSSEFGLKSLLFGSQLLVNPLIFLPFAVILYGWATVWVIQKKLWHIMPSALIPLAGLVFLVAGVPGLYYWGLFYLPALGLTAPLTTGINESAGSRENAGTVPLNSEMNNNRSGTGSARKPASG